MLQIFFLHCPVDEARHERLLLFRQYVAHFFQNIQAFHARNLLHELVFGTQAFRRTTFSVTFDDVDLYNPTLRMVLCRKCSGKKLIDNFGIAFEVKRYVIDIIGELVLHAAFSFELRLEDGFHDFQCG